MTGRVKTPTEIQQAVVLRAGGYSLAAIANKTGISASTLQRHFAKHRAKKGAISEDAISEAKQSLLNDAGFIDGLKRQIAASISDDIAHVTAIREAMALTLDELLNDKNLPAHYRTRGLAALATTLKLMHAILCGAGHNIRMILRQLRIFLPHFWRPLCRILTQPLSAPFLLSA